MKNIYVLIGLMGAFSIILGIIENFIPTPVPAIRLGLSNVPILIMIYLSSSKYACQVAFLKALIVPILSANIIFKISLSVPATFISFIFMALFYHFFNNKISIITISVIGAISHIITQLIIVNIFYIKGIIYTNIAGILLLSSTITGIFMGIIAYKIVNHNQIKVMFKMLQEKAKRKTATQIQK